MLQIYEALDLKYTTNNLEGLYGQLPDLNIYEFLSGTTQVKGPIQQQKRINQPLWGFFSSVRMTLVIIF